MNGLILAIFLSSLAPAPQYLNTSLTLGYHLGPLYAQVQGAADLRPELGFSATNPSLIDLKATLGMKGFGVDLGVTISYSTPTTVFSPNGPHSITIFAGWSSWSGTTK